MTEPLKSKFDRGAIAWMARNPVAANLLMVLLLGGGFWSALHIQKEVFPQFALDVVRISVAYPGASPAEVEMGIVQPVESAVRGIPGIREMTSTAYEGSGSISIELVSNYNRMKAFQEIDQAVNRIRTFPEDTEEPEVRLLSQQRDVMEIGLYGEVDPWTLRQFSERLRDRLMAEPSITQVELGNVPDYMTHVEIPKQLLRTYGMGLSDVAELIRLSSEDIPAGAVETRSGEILLRLKSRKEWADEFADIEILPSANGSSVKLGDIADLRDGFEDSGFHSRFNNQPSVELEIFRLGNQSPLDIAASVRAILKDLETTLPEGVQTRIDSSRARDFEQRLSLLLENGFLAILIVLGILALFLELRLGFWVMMGMTISFVGGILFLPPVGVSINMISMFAFLVVLGIVVDDAIVVGENIYEWRQQGMPPLEAAIKGAREMAWPVTFSILSTVVAFIPLLFIPGTTGKFWWPLPAVVIVVLIVSLLEALFILPAHLAHAGKAMEKGKARKLAQWQRAFAKAFHDFVHTRYRSLLNLCLKFRYITVFGAFAVFAIVGGFGFSGHMGMILMPEVAADEIEAGIRLPVGTTLDRAGNVALEVTAATRRMFDEHELERVAEGIKTNVRGQNFIDVEIVMKPPEERDMTAAEVIALWRDEIGDIEGVDQVVFEAERGPGGWRQDISVDLSHSNIDFLEAASQAFLERMEAFTETRDVSDNFNKGKLQFDVRLLAEGRRLDLTAEEVGRQLRDAYFGALALRYLRGTEEVEVRVKLPEEERQHLRSFENFMVRTPDGNEVPLLDVVEVNEGEAFTSIERRDGRRIVNVSMDIEPKRAIGRVLEAIEREVLPEIRAEFPGLTWTYSGSQAEMRDSTRALWGGFALAMAVVYALLAVAFSSYTQPLIVMMAIPFGIVGAVIGHLLMGFDLSLVSLMGVIALSGVVVNDSLIMVDYANRLRRDGTKLFEAILQAGCRRFRPIALTTLTTFGGLTPIILEKSQQANYLIPMAISLGFGIVFATAIILVLVPCLYLLHEDVGKVFSSRA